MVKQILEVRCNFLKKDEIVDKIFNIYENSTKLNLKI